MKPKPSHSSSEFECHRGGLDIHGEGHLQPPKKTAKKICIYSKLVLKKGWWVKGGLGHFWSWFSLSSQNIRVPGCQMGPMGTIAIVPCPGEISEIIHAVARTWFSNSPANPAIKMERESGPDWQIITQRKIHSGEMQLLLWFGTF